MDQFDDAMDKTTNHTHTRYAREAMELFAAIILGARLEKDITTQELADSNGLSRGLLQRIQKGDPSSSII